VKGRERAALRAVARPVGAVSNVASRLPGGATYALARASGDRGHGERQRQRQRPRQRSSAAALREGGRGCGFAVISLRRASARAEAGEAAAALAAIARVAATLANNGALLR